MNIALLPDRLTKGNGPPTAFKTVEQPAFPVVQTMHTAREKSNRGNVDRGADVKLLDLHSEVLDPSNSCLELSVQA